MRISISLTSRWLMVRPQRSVPKIQTPIPVKAAGVWCCLLPFVSAMPIAVGPNQ